MYPQNPQYDAVMARLNNTKPVDQRDPFLSDGEHDLIVHSIAEYNDQKWGQSYRVSFVVEGSTKHPPGSMCVRTFNIQKPAMYPNQPNDADQLAEFICKLQGIELGQHGASAKALLVPRSQGGNAEEQRARGCRIHASGRPPKNGINPQTNRPYTFVPVSWRTVSQDANAISQMRAALDQKYPIQQMQQTPTQQYPQQMQTTQPQQYGQQPQYPVQLMQPPQMYQAAQQPQMMPQGVSPQQTGGYSMGYTMQPAQPQQPMQQPTQYPQQPQQMPMQQPAGYAQPTYGQQPQQPQPVQGAPAGGFLAMLPPK